MVEGSQVERSTSGLPFRLRGFAGERRGGISLEVSDGLFNSDLGTLAGIP